MNMEKSVNESKAEQVFCKTPHINGYEDCLADKLMQG